MTASFQTPSTAPTVLPLHEAPLSTVFVDRDGDTWIPDGTNEAGELRLDCPNPLNPDDRDSDGEGEPHDWTVSEVEAYFGPLTQQPAVTR